MKKKIACVDLFCGAGGLTHGFMLEGLPVVAGIDLDPACRFPYEQNNGEARFLERDISTVTPDELLRLVRLLNQLEDEIETIKCNHRLALEQNE